MTYGKTMFGLLASLAVLLGGNASRVAGAPPANVIGATIPDGIYSIIGNHAGSSSFIGLDVPNGDLRSGIWIQLFPFRNQQNQLWRFRRLEDGHYLITGVQSGKALDVPFGDRRPGIQIQQYTPNSGANQRWRLDKTFAYNGPDLSRPEYFRIVNKASGLNLDVPFGNYAATTKVQQYTPNTGWNQTWLIRPAR